MTVYPSCVTNEGMAKMKREPHGSVSEVYVPLRAPADLIEQADRLRRTLGAPGRPLSRSRVLREALRIGLRTLARRKGSR